MARRVFYSKGAKSKSAPRVRPTFITPMAAQPVDELPDGPEWWFELKLDGYRALIIKDGAKVQIRSRNDKDLARMYPSIATTAAKLRAEQAIIDGEIIALDEKGRPSFQALQHPSSYPKHHMVFYAFDLLHLNGEDLTSKALLERRAPLTEVLGDSGLLLSQGLEGSAANVVQSVKALGLEGVVAKRRDSVYVPGERSSDWVKLKLELQQEFVIGGYRPGGTGIDALLVGYYEGKSLRFAGKVRAGFVPNTRRQVLGKLQPLKTTRCPFSDLPLESSSRWGGGVSAEEMKEMTWTRPEAVAQIRFVEWTGEGRLRLAKFLGLRFDKVARDVRRERP
jgi:bifunctional non-homologous end joining protein LigD